ncbi:carbohydrate-binding protein [Streptomyces xanthophaeus]|uniref:carbohydrate-binding protein n=1 Tax=Streptomyces xanthophaeus TaxID=67385 RepID=UPI00099D00E5
MPASRLRPGTRARKRGSGGYPASRCSTSEPSSPAGCWGRSYAPPPPFGTGRTTSLHTSRRRCPRYKYFVASTDASGEFSVPSGSTTGGGHAVPEWGSSTSYEIGDAVLYRGNVYRCLQRHTSNVSWTPTAAVTLWKRS